MECPTCGKSLRTVQGMRQHHTKVNGDPLPNRTCKGCGTEFYDSKARRSFCENCNPNAGKHNGNWSGATQTATCATCGDSFSFYPSNKDGIYCPDCVESAEGLLPENPSEPGERISVPCHYCETELEGVPSRVANRSQGVFCSRECHGEWLSEHVVGPDHHQWEGGPIEYGRSWWRIRRQALERDDYECQQCGVDADQLGRNPDVHHVRPVRSFDRPAEAHTLANVISLCRSCHRRVEAGSIKVSTEPEK